MIKNYKNILYILTICCYLTHYAAASNSPTAKKKEIRSKAGRSSTRKKDLQIDLSPVEINSSAKESKGKQIYSNKKILNELPAWVTADEPRSPTIPRFYLSVEENVSRIKAIHALRGEEPPQNNISYSGGSDNPKEGILSEVSESPLKNDSIPRDSHVLPKVRSVKILKTALPEIWDEFIEVAGALFERGVSKIENKLKDGVLPAITQELFNFTKCYPLVPQKSGERKLGDSITLFNVKHGNKETKFTTDITKLKTFYYKKSLENKSELKVKITLFPTMHSSYFTLGYHGNQKRKSGHSTLQQGLQEDTSTGSLGYHKNQKEKGQSKLQQGLQDDTSTGSLGYHSYQKGQKGQSTLQQGLQEDTSTGSLGYHSSHPGQLGQSTLQQGHQEDTSTGSAGYHSNQQGQKGQSTLQQGLQKETSTGSQGQLGSDVQNFEQEILILGYVSVRRDGYGNMSVSYDPKIDRYLRQNDEYISEILQKTEEV